MVKLIMGLMGSGKTKTLIELIHSAVEEERGDVVCIEKGAKLTYDIPYKVRLVDSSRYDFSGYECLKGFICGLCSANYDITHIFFDSVLKIIGVDFDDRAKEFLEWCEGFSERESVNFTLTYSVDVSMACERLRKYF